MHGVTDLSLTENVISPLSQEGLRPPPHPSGMFGPAKLLGHVCIHVGLEVGAHADMVQHLQRDFAELLTAA